MKTKANTEVIKKALAMLHGKAGTTPEGQGDPLTVEIVKEKKTLDYRTTQTESLATRVLAEFEPAEAVRIAAVWRNVFGIALDSERVRKHLESLRQWQKQWRSIHDRSTTGL